MAIISSTKLLLYQVEIGFSTYKGYQTKENVEKSI